MWNELLQAREAFHQAGLATLVNILIHSTLWLGGAYLFLRWKGDGKPALQDAVWKAALLGSLLSPGLQFALGNPSWWGELHLYPEATTMEREWVTSTANAKGEDTAHSAPLFLNRSEISLPAREDPVSSSSKALPVSPPTPRSAEPSDFQINWEELILNLWMGLSSGFLILLWIRKWQLRRGLRDTRPCLDPKWQQMLVELCGSEKRARRIQLLVSKEWDVPVALGLWHHRIILPERALTHLEEKHQRSLLGHEIAHFLRRDPLWLRLLQLCECAFFFQPLYRLARKNSLAAAEQLCDTWSAQRNADHLSMAQCLTEVAGWLDPQRKRALALSMACHPPLLRRRVEHLLYTEHTDRKSRGRIWSVGALLLCLGLSPWALPGIQLNAATPSSTGEEGSASSLAENLPREPHSPENRANTDLKESIGEVQVLLQQELQLLEMEIHGLRNDLVQAGLEAQYDTILQQLQNRLHSLQTKQKRLQDWMSQ